MIKMGTIIQSLKKDNKPGLYAAYNYKMYHFIKH